jgi:hypothetical protein
VGLKMFPTYKSILKKRVIYYDLHYVKGTGLNESMSNGSFFRVTPGTFSSGSYSGYPSAFPLKLPFNCKLTNISLIFRLANFDWNATAGNIILGLEIRTHLYNGSSVHSEIIVPFGNFSGNNTGTDTHKYILTEDDFYYFSGVETINKDELIGVRFIKPDASVGDRRINSFVDIVMKLEFEEV